MINLQITTQAVHTARLCGYVFLYQTAITFFLATINNRFLIKLLNQTFILQILMNTEIMLDFDFD